jgi:hypothetical protein
LTRYQALIDKATRYQALIDKALISLFYINACIKNTNWKTKVYHLIDPLPSPY